MKTKSWFFLKIDKIVKILGRLSKKRENTNYQYRKQIGEITTDSKRD
jgi:hypothetical protein